MSLSRPLERTPRADPDPGLPAHGAAHASEPASDRDDDSPGNFADSGLCPLCGRSNRCAMELERMTGQTQSACWCTQVTFDAAALARIPTAARGRACLCPACAQGHA